MTRKTCDREQDVLDAVASRRWPGRAGEDLSEHVASCRLCADLACVVEALLNDGELDAPVRELPPASLVWWRAQLRAREEAARAALRPIRTVQAAALACAGVLVIGAAIVGLPVVTGAVSTALGHAIAAISRLDAQAAADAAMSPLANRGVQIAAGAWLILAPVAAYLAFSRE